MTSYDFKRTYVYTYYLGESEYGPLDITRYKRQNVSNSLYVGHITGTSD